MASALSHTVVAIAFGKIYATTQMPPRFWMLSVACSILPDVDVIAMTNGGLGVACFSPFDHTRYFLPWTPVEVSPIGIEAFLSPRGVAVLLSEIKWIWLPSGLLLLAVLAFRKA